MKKLLSKSSTTYGVILRLIAVFCFSLTFFFVKLIADEGVHVVEILFYRYGIGVVFLFLTAYFYSGIRSLKTKRPMLHANRAAMGLVAMTMNFLAVILMPLAEAATISFTVPLITTILAAVMLGEKLDSARIIAIVAGFVGVIFVINPTNLSFANLGFLAAVCGAVVSAFVLIYLKKMVETETSIAIVFWYFAFATPLLFVCTLFVDIDKSRTTILLLVTMGIVGAIGQVLLAESQKFAPISLLLPLDYCYLIFSVILGYMFWQDWPGSGAWLGAFIIVSSSLYVTIYGRKKQN